MKKLLIIVGAVIAVLVIAVIIVPFAIPTETYKSQIESRVSAATGRDLRINGPVRLSLFPAVAVVANDVTFANTAGTRDPSMATLDKLDVHVSVVPLLSGNVEISRLVLEKPVIHLEVDRQGKANWGFAAANATPAQAPAAQSQNRQASSGSSGPSDIALGDVRLNDGTVTYTDDRSGVRYEISAINATVKLPNLDSPLAADGSLVWNNEKLSLTANASSPRGLMTGKGSDIALKLDSKPVAIAFTGRGEGTPLKLTGELDLGTPSVRNLAAWAGQPLQLAGNGLGPLSIKGTLAAAPQHVSFTKASYKLDAMEASGDVAVDSSGRVPAIKASLTTNVLDLNPYLPPEQKAPAQGQGQQPRSPAQTPQSGWSTDPIDLSGLKAANADLALTTAGLVVRKIKVGKSALHVTLDGGKLTSDLTEMALYDGNGKARVTVDGSGRVPAVAMNFNIDGVQAQPLLKDAMDMDRLTGAAVADGSVSGSGASQRDLISALNGKGSLKLRNGKIRGLDIGSMVKNIGSAFSSSDNQQTEFAEASATYTITNGVVRNDDLAMNAPLFQVTGKGTVDLPKRTVDYRVVPKVGVGVPIIVSGPWDNISYRPDLASAIPDAQQSIRGLRDMFRGGGSPQGQGAPPEGQGQQAPQQPSSNNPLDRLNNMLGR
jgi:AsmA protein